MVSEQNERERMQLMRMMLVAAQTVILVNNVAEVSVSAPLLINVNNAAQSFEGWGTSLAWFGEYIGGLEDTQRDKVADLLFDPDYGLGLEIIRYNIGGSDTNATAVNSLRPGAAVPSLLLPNGTYNWTLDWKQANMMFAARDRGALIFEAFSNSPPWFMTISGVPSGNVDGAKDNLPSEKYDAYVDYLTEVVSFYRHELNFTFRTLEPFNEPSAHSWFAGFDQEGCHYDPATQDIILQKLYASLVEKELSPETGISASDEYQYESAIYTFEQYGDSLKYIDQINTHGYHITWQAGLGSLADKAGKRLWMSEYSSGPYEVTDIRTGLALSLQVLGDLKQGKVQGWVYWQAVENIHGGGPTWGLLQMPFEDSGPGDIPIQFSKQFYALMQYSKFIKNGWTILNTADEYTLAAMQQDDNDDFVQIAVVVTNDGLYNETADWSFGLLVDPVSVEVFRTSATEDFAQLPSVELPTSGLLQYALPPSTITTFYSAFVLAPVQPPPQATEENLAEL